LFVCKILHHIHILNGYFPEEMQEENREGTGYRSPGKRISSLATSENKIKILTFNEYALFRNSLNNVFTAQIATTDRQTTTAIKGRSLS